MTVSKNPNHDNPAVTRASTDIRTKPMPPSLASLCRLCLDVRDHLYDCEIQPPEEWTSAFNKQIGAARRELTALVGLAANPDQAASPLPPDSPRRLDGLPALLSTAQVAEVYGVSSRQVRNWLTRGNKFPNAYQAETKWLVLLDDVKSDLLKPKHNQNMRKSGKSLVKGVASLKSTPENTR